MMTVDEIMTKLRGVRTMPELDALRLDCVRTGEATGDMEVMREIQRTFIKAKDRLERIPLRDRNW